MAVGGYAAKLVATCVVAAQPFVAVAQDIDRNERRSAAFGGLKLSMPLGHGERVKPTARLQLTSSQQLRDTRTGEVRSFSPPGLEFGTSAKGKAMLFVGGQETGEIKKKMGIGRTGTTLLIVGGIVVVVVVAAAAASAQADLLNPCDGGDLDCD